jgi:ABC-type branched-subunit amino acid transport system permease subunit
MLSLATLRQDTKVYLKVIIGEDPEYPDPLRRRWYPSVAFRQRMSCVACSLHTFLSLVLLAGLCGLPTLTPGRSRECSHGCRTPGCYSMQHSLVTGPPAVLVAVAVAAIAFLSICFLDVFLRLVQKYRGEEK